MLKNAIIILVLIISSTILGNRISVNAQTMVDSSYEDRLSALERKMTGVAKDSFKFNEFINEAIEWPKWLAVGMGLRTSFSAVEEAVDDGDDWSQDFALENMRLYVNGNITDKISLEFNTERFDSADAHSDIRVLDAVAKFSFNKMFNIWVGRMLPPSDRSNLDGPYFLNSFDFPFVQAYPAIFAGRLEGLSIWGQSQMGPVHVKYQLGAFDEFVSTRAGGPNDDDDLIYTGRLTFNFWDPEPGYYNNSTYYGDKDILAIGLVGFFQNNGAGSRGDRGDFVAWNIDFLLEKKLSNGGVVNLEAAFYNYDLDGKQAAETASGGGLVDGHSYLAVASYLFPQKIGWGQIQPIVRYMNFNQERHGGTRERWEVGAAYIIDGHNARVNFFYANEHPGRGTRGGDDDSFGIIKIGLQLQRWW
ncbi:MAG: hypothetical protein ACUZ8E_15045 [Candidatus Anammoxibacter sp.]